MSDLGLTYYYWNLDSVHKDLIYAGLLPLQEQTVSINNNCVHTSYLSEHGNLRCRRYMTMAKMTFSQSASVLLSWSFFLVTQTHKFTTTVVIHGNVILCSIVVDFLVSSLCSFIILLILCSSWPYFYRVRRSIPRSW